MQITHCLPKCVAPKGGQHCVRLTIQKLPPKGMWHPASSITLERQLDGKHSGRRGAAPPPLVPGKCSLVLQLPLRQQSGMVAQNWLKRHYTYCSLMPRHPACWISSVSAFGRCPREHGWPIKKLLGPRRVILRWVLPGGLLRWGKPSITQHLIWPSAWEMHIQAVPCPQGTAEASWEMP